MYDSYNASIEDHFKSHSTSFALQRQFFFLSFLTANRWYAVFPFSIFHFAKIFHLHFTFLALIDAFVSSYFNYLFEFRITFEILGKKMEEESRQIIHIFTWVPVRHPQILISSIF